MPFRILVVGLVCVFALVIVFDRPSEAERRQSRAVANVITTNGFGFRVRKAAFKIAVPGTPGVKGKDMIFVMMQGPNLKVESGDVIALSLEGPEGIVNIGDLTSAVPDGATMETFGAGLRSVPNSTIGGFQTTVKVTLRNTSTLILIKLTKGSAGDSPSLPNLSSQNGVPIVVNLQVLRGTTLFHARQLQNFLIRKKTSGGVTRVQAKHRT